MSQLLTFNSIEEAKEYALEKEIESVLRMSHVEQFLWLEKKFEIELRKDLPAWQTFVELTERRNLFVHCDGIVSSHYMTVCKAQKVVLADDVRVGHKLGVDPEYFQNAYACVFEIGVKLTHVLWRKVVPEDRLAADHALNDDTLYELIAKGKYGLAIIIGEFAIHTIKRHVNDSVRRRMLLNLAQAYKWAGQAEKCAALIGKEDWSSCRDDFSLVVAVLKDDFTTAQAAMKRLGKDGLVSEAYPYWPIFKEFRKSKEFAEAYEEIHGVAFSTIQTAVTPKGLFTNTIRKAIAVADSASRGDHFPEYVI